MHHDESCTRANSLFHYASTGKFDQLRRIVVRRWLHYLATTESSVTQTRFRTSQLFPLSNATTLNIEYLLCRRGNEAIAITNISTRFSNSIFSPFRDSKSTSQLFREESSFLWSISIFQLFPLSFSVRSNKSGRRMVKER